MAPRGARQTESGARLPHAGIPLAHRWTRSSSEWVSPQVKDSNSFLQLGIATLGAGILIAHYGFVLQYPITTIASVLACLAAAVWAWTSLPRFPFTRLLTFGGIVVLFAVGGIFLRSSAPRLDIGLMPELVTISISDYIKTIEVLSFAAAISLIVYGITRRFLAPSGRPANIATSSPSASQVWSMLTVGYALLILRIYLFSAYGLGLPAYTPESLAAPGAFYHLTHTTVIFVVGYLAYANVVRYHDGLRRARYTAALFSVILVASHVIIYLLQGKRGGPLGLIIVMGIAFASASRRKRWSHFAALGIPAAIVAIAMFGLAATQRTSLGQIDRRAALPVAIYRRLGGVNFAAPLFSSDVEPQGLEALSRYGPLVNQHLYGISPDAPTAFAITAWGTGFLAFGYAGLVLVSVVIGSMAGFADSLVHRKNQTSSVDAALYASLLLIWFLAIQEGNLLARLDAALVIIGFYAVARVLR